jgi:hypothetical protein
MRSNSNPGWPLAAAAHCNVPPNDTKSTSNRKHSWSITIKLGSIGIEGRSGIPLRIAYERRWYEPCDLPLLTFTFTALLGSQTNYNYNDDSSADDPIFFAALSLFIYSCTCISRLKCSTFRQVQEPDYFWWKWKILVLALNHASVSVLWL